MWVHTAGNVKLRPELLESHQAYVKEQLKSENPKPVFLVFHGGSGSTKSEISTAVKAGVVKMNVSCLLYKRNVCSSQAHTDSLLSSPRRSTLTPSGHT
jgi:fructose/tagatose bisphosphate aldolase